MTYAQVHQNVKKVHGLASLYQCIECPDQALDWAYQHDARVEYRSEDNRPYAEGHNHYRPMCRACHQELDMRMCPKIRESRIAQGRRAGAITGIRKSNKTHRQCAECPMFSKPGALGMHQRKTGHRGYTQLATEDLLALLV